MTQKTFFPVYQIYCNFCIAPFITFTVKKTKIYHFTRNDYTFECSALTTKQLSLRMILPRSI